MVAEEMILAAGECLAIVTGSIDWGDVVIIIVIIRGGESEV